MGWFHYKWSKILRIDFTVVILLGVAAAGVIAIQRGEERNGILLIVTTYALFVPFYVNARLLASQIYVDAEVITWSAFGVRWRTIRWRTVKRIRRLKSYDLFAGRVVSTYCIDLDSNHAFYFLPKGPIVFDETIEGFDELLSLINGYATDHQIPVVAITNKLVERLDRLY